MTIESDEIEERIEEFFEENMATLALESGHSLSPQARETARQQVLVYWRKLRAIAERVTDTEVGLSLPQNRSPDGRTFAIEGIVDIVREDERVVMYDIKTHETEAIRANIEDYERQLNVYAYIWQNLRGQRLDETAVICTQLPEALKQAANVRDERRMAYELGRWEPVIPIPFEPGHVAETVREFGETVDEIEDGCFAPPDLTTLQARLPGTTRTFATDICRYCDARFSCASYRQYAHAASRGVEARFRQYFDDFGDETTQADRLVTGLTE
ncbi:MAG: PD-(D/E)XK nuclease family protein [Anaerolineae bacterium]|nr:PD-(D/E)XK nuclease family protein [Anaerolineae bacterium]